MCKDPKGARDKVMPSGTPLWKTADRRCCYGGLLVVVVVFSEFVLFTFIVLLHQNYDYTLCLGILCFFFNTDRPTHALV